MSIDRRRLLKTGLALSAAAALPNAASADVAFDLQPGAWRSFQIVTRLDIADVGDRRQAWVPVPAVNERDWFKSLGNAWTSNGRVSPARDPKYGAEMLHVEWADDEKNPFVEVTSRITTRDRATDFARPAKVAPLSAADRALHTQGTELIPVDGIVKETSDGIVASANAATNVEKARALYAWIVDNTFRDPKVRGCGIGDIAAMLKTGNLGGKWRRYQRALCWPCSRGRFTGTRSLWHSRRAVEVRLQESRCVPVDAADVRKVVLEEPPKKFSIDDPKVVAARKTLFGAWEGNWLAYNFAHDLALEGSKGQRIAFLMYPHAECGDARLDCLDPDIFKYTITAKELTAA